MKRHFDRYVISECLPSLGLSLAVFTFVLLMHRLLRLSDLVIAKGVPVLEVLRLLALALPAVMPLLLPLSLLLAVLLAFGRLSADSEITAMRACGVSLGQNVAPVAALSLLATAVTASVSLWAEPLATHALKDAVFQTVKNRISVTAQAGTFTDLSDGITLYAGGLDDDTGELKDLFLYLDRPPAKAFWVLARSGSIREAPQGLLLDLEAGELHQYAGTGAAYRRLFFDRYRVVVPLPAAVAEEVDVQEMPTREVVRRASGGGSPQDVRAARLEFHRRLALPASCLVFGLLGATLGLHHTRAGRSRSVTVCLAVVIAYYALLTGGRALGDRGRMAPWLAMWLPDLTLGIFAAFAFQRKNRETPLPLEEAIGRALSALRRRLRPPGEKP